MAFASRAHGTAPGAAAGRLAGRERRAARPRTVANLLIRTTPLIGRKGGVEAPRWTTIALAAVLFGAMAMRLLPLASFAVWGSDWGENYALTDALVRDGAVPEGYLGWGEAYPDFPGLFALAGSGALVLGVGTAEALSVLVPCATALSVLVAACIVLRLRNSAAAALLAAALLAVAFPEVFTNSHPVSGPLGSTLVMAVMLVFIMGDAWRRGTGVDAPRPWSMYVLMLVLVAGLGPLHHLSHYFALIAVGMAHLVRAVLVRGAEPHREAWGEYSFLLLLVTASVYWLGLTPTFRQEVMVDLLGVPGAVVMLGVWALAAVFLLLARWLARRDRGVLPIHLSGGAELRAYVLSFALVAAAIIAAVSVWGVPGTAITPDMSMVAYFLPIALLLALTVGASEVLLRIHGGHIVVAWLAAVGASFLLASAMRSEVLVSYRHVPYAIEAAAVLLGIGAVQIRRMAVRPGLRGSLVMGAAVAALLLALVPTAYPPKDIMGGFQEGTDGAELSAVLWLRDGLPAPGAEPADRGAGAVLTDHRLSSMAFGVGGQMATWDFETRALRAPLDADTVATLSHVGTPNGNRVVAAALVSDDLRTGAAGSQWENARPIEGAGWDKYWQEPFVRLYDGGTAWVMGVDRALLPST